jgi:hypothetical protein
MLTLRLPLPLLLSLLLLTFYAQAFILLLAVAACLAAEASQLQPSAKSARKLMCFYIPGQRVSSCGEPFLLQTLGQKEFAKVKVTDKLPFSQCTKQEHQNPSENKCRSAQQLSCCQDGGEDSDCVAFAAMVKQFGPGDARKLCEIPSTILAGSYYACCNKPGNTAAAAAAAKKP